MGSQEKSRIDDLVAGPRQEEPVLVWVDVDRVGDFVPKADGGEEGNALRPGTPDRHASAGRVLLLDARPPSLVHLGVGPVLLGRGGLSTSTTSL